MSDKKLAVKPLTQAGFAAYGEVIESANRDSFLINNEMAQRFHALARVGLKGDAATAIISIVDSRQYQLPRRVDHLEHHPLGSQAFIPLDHTPFIVVVAKACDRPAAADLEAFVSNGQQGINYHIGTWHHVLLTPVAAMRFLCVDRQGAGNNCIDYNFPENEQLLLDYKPDFPD